jgi:hypothetical protein
MSDRKASRTSKGHRGIAMEGIVAKWYAGNQKKMIGQYKSWAHKVSRNLAEGSSVFEVAPGPGYLPEIALHYLVLSLCPHEPQNSA